MAKDLEIKIIKALKEKKWHISFAESCTGGLLAATLINGSGASSVLSESYVTYSIDAKMKILNVKKATLDKYTVYSKEVAEEMAQGLKKITNSNVCVSVTGEAESSSDECKCYYTIIVDDKVITEMASFKGSRNEIRNKQVQHIFSQILEHLKA